MGHLINLEDIPARKSSLIKPFNRENRPPEKGWHTRRDAEKAAILSVVVPTGQKTSRQAVCSLLSFMICRTWESGRFFGSIEHICNHIFLSRASVGRALRFIKDQGFLRVIGYTALSRPVYTIHIVNPVKPIPKRVRRPSPQYAPTIPSDLSPSAHLDLLVFERSIDSFLSEQEEDYCAEYDQITSETLAHGELTFQDEISEGGDKTLAHRELRRYLTVTQTLAHGELDNIRELKQSNKRKENHTHTRHNEENRARTPARTHAREGGGFSGEKFTVRNGLKKQSKSIDSQTGESHNVVYDSQAHHTAKIDSSQGAATTISDGERGSIVRDQSRIRKKPQPAESGKNPETRKPSAASQSPLLGESVRKKKTAAGAAVAEIIGFRVESAAGTEHNRDQTESNRNPSEGAGAPNHVQANVSPQSAQIERHEAAEGAEVFKIDYSHTGQLNAREQTALDIWSSGDGEIGQSLALALRDEGLLDPTQQLYTFNDLFDAYCEQRERMLSARDKNLQRRAPVTGHRHDPAKIDSLSPTGIRDQAIADITAVIQKYHPDANADHAEYLCAQLNLLYVADRDAAECVRHIARELAISEWKPRGGLSGWLKCVAKARRVRTWKKFREQQMHAMFH